jgi:hypothetical protein
MTHIKGFSKSARDFIKKSARKKMSTPTAFENLFLWALAALGDCLMAALIAFQMLYVLKIEVENTGSIQES